MEGSMCIVPRGRLSHLHSAPTADGFLPGCYDCQNVAVVTEDQIAVVKRTMNACHKPKKNLSVSFSAMSEVILFDDYYDEERLTGWYTKDEYQDIEESCWEDVYAFRKRNGAADSLDCVNQCIRGLENRKWPSSIHVTFERQFRVLEAVFCEQDMQLTTGEYDDTELALASIRQSVEARFQAQERGEQDARFAMIELHRLKKQRPELFETYEMKRKKFDEFLKKVPTAPPVMPAPYESWDMCGVVGPGVFSAFARR